MKKTKTFIKENLEKAVINSSSYKEVLIKLGLRAAGGNYKQLKKYLELYNIDDSKIISTRIENNIQHIRNINKPIPLSEILIENSTYSRTHLKNRLLKIGIKKNVCELCGQDENWHGKKITLILDHVNGVYNDNRLENLRIVCPNCETTLETHCGKHIKLINKCSDCGKKRYSKSKQCLNCYNKNTNSINYKIEKRKVERPSYKILLKEISELGYCATGRKYGVSDNASRKWIKHFEKYNN